jgi:hypothetical protein
MVDYLIIELGGKGLASWDVHGAYPNYFKP